MIILSKITRLYTIRTKNVLWWTPGLLHYQFVRKKYRAKAQVSYCHSAPSVVVLPKLVTFSTSSPEPLDGFWWNLVGIKYSWSLTIVVVFRPDVPEVSNFFSSGAQLKTAGAPRCEAKGFTEARSAERGRVGEGVIPSRRWGSGVPPPGNFLKIASKWCILVHFGAVNWKFKPKIYMKKMCLSIRKDFILDTKTFRFFFQIYCCI